MQISENREQRTGYIGKLEYFNTIKEAVTMTLTEEDPVLQLRALKLASLIHREERSVGASSAVCAPTACPMTIRGSADKD